MKKKHRHVGSDFDDFLRDEGLLADAEALAIKRVLAGQLESVTQQFTNCDTLSTH